jgi:hypothetical protein
MLLLAGFVIWLLVAALVGMCLGGAIRDAEHGEHSQSANAARHALGSDRAKAATAPSEATAAA